MLRSTSPVGRAVPGEPSCAGPPPSRRPFHHRLTLAAVVLLVLGYFFWTNIVSFDEVPRIGGKEHREYDHYNLLSRGFLKGHLHLDAEPPAALLAAPNPYDPKSRGPVEVLHDASLYQGKYYIYFGPAPVVTLFLPFTVLTGRDLPIPYGVLLFASGAYLALAATFLFVQRRHFPTASLCSIVIGLFALGGASMLVAFLRRPHIWEIAGACGLFYFSLALYCLVRAIHSPRPIRWTAAGGLALGLAIAARPTWIVCSPLFALPLLLHPPARLRTERDPYSFGALFAAAGTCTAVVLALFAYNYARFDNPLEFGQKYQLSAVIEGEQRHFSFTYPWWNFHTYFLTPANWQPSFPFYNGVTLTPPPAGHGGYEYSFGIFPNLPIALFALIVPLALARRRCRGLEDKRKRATLGAIAGAGFLSTAILLCFFGNCVRYMADFTPWLILLAACAILALDVRLTSRWPRAFFHAATFSLALFSTALAAAGVVRIYHFTERLPQRYLPVARALNYPVFALRQLSFPDFRPQELSLAFPADRSPRQQPLLAIARDGKTTAELFIDYLGNNQLRLGYREPGSPQPHFSPVIAPPADTPQKLHLSLGHDYADYDGHTSRLRVQLNDWPLWNAPVVSFHAVPGELRLAAGAVQSARAITLAEFAPPRLGGARIQIIITPEMVGRAFPLLTSGRSGAGNLLFFRVAASGRVTLGYDHWADRLRFSSELPTAFGRPHVFEFWIPPSTPAFNAKGDRELLVRLDGAVVWREPVPWFPTTPKTLYVGANPIGGSTCEPVLVNGVIAETQLPFPSTP